MTAPPASASSANRILADGSPSSGTGVGPRDVPGILVTATSSNHFAQLRGLLHTAQLHLPRRWRIIVYDLLDDLSPSDVGSLREWCGVEYRRFNASRVRDTWERNYLTLSVWKPFIIYDCLREVPRQGIVLYADTSTRLHEELSNELLTAVQSIGFVGRRTASPVAMYTHPMMAVELARGRQRRRDGDRFAVAEAANLSAHYMDAPMVCGCVSLWANTPAVMHRLIRPWAECAMERSCILPHGADGQDNRIGLSTRCRPGLEGHCHRGDQSALSIILYEAFRVRDKGVADYLHNTEVSAETWKMCRARLHGTVFTTERANRQSVSPIRHADPGCTRGDRADVASLPNADAKDGRDAAPLTHGEPPRQPALQFGGSCSGLVLTRVAVPTGIQPIFPGMGGPGASLRRLLKPCATEHACTVGADGCFLSQPRHVAIARCNATHGVEYEHRLPDDGEPAIVSFFSPSASHVRDALAAVANARPRLFFDFEPPMHSRVPQAQVLRGVDGQMTYARRALVHYPYLSAAQLWSAALKPTASQGFDERRPAIAVFVSNCRGHRAEAIDWLRQRFDVHSYGACRHGGNTTGLASERRQRVEGGHFPECQHYRAILAIENNACEDYVSEKLLEAIRCGGVPIVRTFKGLPDYRSLFGPLPLLDAEVLDEAFESRLRAVLTQRDAWERYMPSRRPSLAADSNAIAARAVRNPHCQLIDTVARFRDEEVPQNRTPLTPIRCETWYKVYSPHGVQTLPRRQKPVTVSANVSALAGAR